MCASSEELLSTIPRVPGIYVLIVKVLTTICLRVRSLGVVEVPEGYVVYVGSAWGFGGLKSRLSRHLRKSKSVKWHIDYITCSYFTRVEAIVYAERAGRELEHVLATEFSKFFKPLARGFGSSDCRCVAHAFIAGQDLEQVLTTVVATFRKHGLNPMLVTIATATNSKSS
ncbi:MAG: hypothetical protein DRJ40_07650 [Thermoprotei archaeon]|nr:MAG: hypothetical protein DRJ40_07650 [Thermoprotei archaeon]